LDESKKANKVNTWPIPSCFHSADKSQIALTLSRSYSARIRAKELKRSLSSPYPKPFQAWMRVRRLTSQHSTYLELFSQHVWESHSARPIFYDADESQIALALSRSYSTLDERTWLT
jgi:hypothetical protein